MNERKVQIPEQLHGGDRYRNDVKLDFSVNTNPLGMPAYIRKRLQEAACTSADIWEWYPDPRCSELRSALAAYHTIPKETIVCGNGASELIAAAVRALARRKGGSWQLHGGTGPKAVLPVPSFGEYERALQAADAQIVYYPLKEKDGFVLGGEICGSLTPDMDMLFLCSPNNPVGNLIPEALLHRILEHCRENGISVLLDECFLELAGGGKAESGNADRKDACRRTCGLLETYPNLILLKAFTKLYAMPGLRLGYCICGDREKIRDIKDQLPCWNVSGIAQLAGMTVLDNEETIDYISQSREMIGRERRYLEAGLETAGMRVLPSSANFICFYAEPSLWGDLYEKLLQRGILIRDCSSFHGMGKGWYRIAVKTRRENELLLEAFVQKKNGKMEKGAVL